MTEKDILQWIKVHLSNSIKEATKGSYYTEDWLAGMACREVGFLIARYGNQPLSTSQVSALMKGDYGQRAGEKKKQYHGYSYWQIDTGSYPDFIKSGDWVDPFKACQKAVSVLDEKKAYLLKKIPTLTGNQLEDAITAAYNCGQGNVFKAIQNNKDLDTYTFNKDYSKEVRRFREIYKTLK